jgi:peroxiredoxin Q/BCP
LIAIHEEQIRRKFKSMPRRQKVKLFKLRRLPAQVIADKQGMARYVHYGHSMNDIPANADLLATLDELNQRA